MTDDDLDDFDVDEALDDVESMKSEGSNTENRERKRANMINEGLESGSNSSESGHIIASRDLKIDRREHSLFAYVHSESRDNVRLGDYVLLPYPNKDTHSELFGVVSGLSYAHRTEINDMEDRLNNAGQIDERRFTLIARISPITIIQSSESSLKPRAVDMIPKPSTYMYPADNEDYLRTGLNIPEEGPFIGHMSVSGEKRPRDNPLPFKMPDDDESGEPAIFRHTLVGGSTGKGKTHFAKNVLRQYASDDRRYQIRLQNPNEGKSNGDETARRMLSTLIIDPENEYTEIGEDNPELDEYDDDDPIPALGGRTISDLKDDGLEVGGVNDSGGPSDMRTYIPDVEYTNPPDVKNSYEFSIPFYFVKHHYQLLLPFEATGPTRSALQDCLRAFFDKNPKGTYDEFEQFMRSGQEWVSESDPISNLGPDHDGFWVDSESFSDDERIFSAVLRRVIRREYSQVFDNGAKELPKASNEMFESGRTTVVPTNHLTGEKERLIVMSLLAHTVDNKLKDRNPDYNVKDSPILLVLDEAHNYLSEPSTAQEEYIVNKYRDASRQGRKYKLGLFMITQNPADVDEEIRKQTNSSIYLGLEPEVIENIRIPGGFDSRIENFGKGEAIVKAPDVKAVEVTGLPICVTKHSK